MSLVDEMILSVLPGDMAEVIHLPSGRTVGVEWLDTDLLHVEFGSPGEPQPIWVLAYPIQALWPEMLGDVERWIATGDDPGGPCW